MRTPALTGDYDRSSLTDLVSHANQATADGLTWFQMKEKEFFVEQDKEYLPIKKGMYFSINNDSSQHLTF